MQSANTKWIKTNKPCMFELISSIPAHPVPVIALGKGSNLVAPNIVYAEDRTSPSESVKTMGLADAAVFQRCLRKHELPFHSWAGDNPHKPWAQSTLLCRGQSADRWQTLVIAHQPWAWGKVLTEAFLTYLGLVLSSKHNCSWTKQNKFLAYSSLYVA